MNTCTDEELEAFLTSFKKCLSVHDLDQWAVLLANYELTADQRQRAGKVYRATKNAIKDRAGLPC